MDETVICACGCDLWVLGASGVRCGKCLRFLPKDVATVNVEKANKHTDGKRRLMEAGHA